jgi:hypothetical protein
VWYLHFYILSGFLYIPWRWSRNTTWHAGNNLLLHTIVVFDGGFHYLPTIRSSNGQGFFSLLSFFRIPMQELQRTNQLLSNFKQTRYFDESRPFPFTNTTHSHVIHFLCPAVLPTLNEVMNSLLISPVISWVLTSYFHY